MPRPRRNIVAGHAYHLLNRGVRRQRLFDRDADYQHFQQLMADAQARVPLRLLGYSVMPNHWHIVAWPRTALEVSAYMHRLTRAHACHVNEQHSFSGHAYQARFTSRVVTDERHLLTVLRYVEANPVRAGLVARAEDWRWSSLHPYPGIVLTESPVKRPACWLDLLADAAEPGLLAAP